VSSQKRFDGGPGRSGSGRDTGDSLATTDDYEGLAIVFDGVEQGRETPGGIGRRYFPHGIRLSDCGCGTSWPPVISCRSASTHSCS